MRQASQLKPMGKILLTCFYYHLWYNFAECFFLNCMHVHKTRRVLLQNGAAGCVPAALLTG